MTTLEVGFHPQEIVSKAAGYSNQAQKSWKENVDEPRIPISFYT